MKNALVVSGGGSRGAFAVGAIEALRDAGISFDLVSGTSTGALIAPMVAIDEIQTLRTIYTSVRTEDIITERDALNILLKDAIYDSHPLWSLINSFITETLYNEIIRSPVEVYLTTINLQTGDITYWNPHNGGPGGSPMSRRSLLRAILASASIPVMMPPVEVEAGGDQYVDGGVREIAPLKIAIDRGATDIYAIVLSPARPEREEARYAFVVKTLMRTINLFTEEVTLNDVETARLYNRAIKHIREARRVAEELLTPDQVGAIFDAPENSNPFADARLLNLHVIRPDRELPSSGLEFRPLIMSQMMEMGREAARGVLAKDNADLIA